MQSNNAITKILQMKQELTKPVTITIKKSLQDFAREQSKEMYDYKKGNISGYISKLIENDKNEKK